MTAKVPTVVTGENNSWGRCGLQRHIVRAWARGYSLTCFRIDERRGMRQRRQKQCETQEESKHTYVLGAASDLSL